MPKKVPESCDIPRVEWAESAILVVDGIILQLESLLPGCRYFDNHPPICPTTKAISDVRKLRLFFETKYLARQPSDTNPPLKGRTKKQPR